MARPKWNSTRAGSWSGSAAFLLLPLFSLLFGCQTAPATAESIEAVVTVSKSSDGFDPAYVLSLTTDGTVSYVGILGPHIVRRSLQLSSEENSAVLRELAPSRIRNLASRPPAPVLLGYGFADISVHGPGPKLTINVDPESPDQMQLFRTLESRLLANRLGCPFMVDVKGNGLEDWCEVGPQYRRKALRGER